MGIQQPAGAVGFSLLEVMVALVVVGLVSAALFYTVESGFNTLRRERLQAEAYARAHGAMEELSTRSLIDLCPKQDDTITDIALIPKTLQDLPEGMTASASIDCSTQATPVAMVTVSKDGVVLSQAIKEFTENGV